MLCIVVHQEGEQAGEDGGGGVALLMTHALYCSSSRRTGRSGWWRSRSTVNGSCSVL